MSRLSLLRRRLPVVAARAAGLVALGMLAAGQATPASAAVAGRPEVRVDQVGYLPGETKLAFVMGEKSNAPATFSVVDAQGHRALRGRISGKARSWNGRYRSVRAIDLSAVTAPGTYTVQVDGARSPRFRVAPASELVAPLVGSNVRFFQAQRDGANVIPAVMGRKPSHLADAAATVYQTPRYTNRGLLVGQWLEELDGPVDVSGGWFDAGDFLKFTHTASYATANLLLAQRSAPNTPGLAAEAAFGLDWLAHMWNPEARTLYIQVGIGQGNDDVLTDHDAWRLPEADDARTTADGARDFLIRNRPVFTGNLPGAPISPNLAGRVAATFALAAQTATDPTVARHWLEQAAAVYGAANLSPNRLVTTSPASFYPESSWADDMEFGAAELAIAAVKLGDGRATAWHADAARFARAYIALAAGAKEPLGLGDVSAIAHAELLSLRDPADRFVAADLRHGLDLAVAHAAKDPFGEGADAREFDSASRAFGMVSTERLYARATGDQRYRAFATQQRGWAFGANAWGSSFMIGAGTVYPRCPQHQVANLAGAGQLTGAVVNGPNDADQVRDLEGFRSMKPCAAHPAGPWERFDGHGERYLDEVRSWSTVEPSLDYTATALLALALTTD